MKETKKAKRKKKKKLNAKGDSEKEEEDNADSSVLSADASLCSNNAESQSNEHKETIEAQTNTTQDEQKRNGSSSECEKNATSGNEYEDCTDTVETNEFSANEKVKRTSKIPPVDIWTETQQATQLLIRCQMPMYSCVFAKINKSKLRVLPKTIDIRKKLMEMLDKRKISYNTYTPSDAKMVNVLLKGTELSSVEVIEDAMIQNGIKPHKIQRYVTGYMRKNGVNSNI